MLPVLLFSQSFAVHFTCSRIFEITSCFFTRWNKSICVAEDIGRISEREASPVLSQKVINACWCSLVRPEYVPLTYWYRTIFEYGLHEIFFIACLCNCCCELADDIKSMGTREALAEVNWLVSGSSTNGSTISAKWRNPGNDFWSASMQIRSINLAKNESSTNGIHFAIARKVNICINLANSNVSFENPC